MPGRPAAGMTRTGRRVCSRCRKVLGVIRYGYDVPKEFADSHGLCKVCGKITTDVRIYRSQVRQDQYVIVMGNALFSLDNRGIARIMGSVEDYEQDLALMEYVPYDKSTEKVKRTVREMIGFIAENPALLFA